MFRSGRGIKETPISQLSLMAAFGRDIQHGVQFPGFVSQQALQVTDETVDVALASVLVDDVLVVVVSQATAQLLVVHLGLVLPAATASSHLEEEGENDKHQWTTESYTTS